jgi:hypothetical protein
MARKTSNQIFQLISMKNYKHIVLLLIAFGAACVSTKKYHRTAQTIVDFAQATVDSVQGTSGLRNTACRHIWVGVEKDTIPEADWHIYHRVDTLHVYGKDLACIKCLEQRKQIWYSPQSHYRRGPRTDNTSTLKKRKP